MHRRLSPYVVLLLCACGSAGGRAELATSEVATETEAIRLILADWHSAASTGDEEKYFSYLAPDAIFLGPDEQQHWTVDALREYAVPKYGEKGFPIRALRYDALLSGDGRDAWVEEDLDTDVLGPARGTGWMRRNDDGKWRIMRYSLVLTIPESRIGEVKRALASEPPQR
jgi:hypothetical protein